MKLTLLLIAAAGCALAAGAAAADPIADAKSGQDALNRGDSNGAVALFSRAIESRGLSREGLESAYVERATAYVSLHQYDWALADLDLAQGITPDDPDARTLRAQIPPTEGLDQAVAATRGAALYGRGDYNGALVALNRAVALNANDDYSLYERGLTWLALQQWDRAIADFTTVIKLKPTWGAYDERGAAWGGRGDYDRGIADYNTAIHMRPTDGPSYFGRGQVYAAKGDSANAIADFTKALDLQPNIEAYLYARCMIRAAANVQLDLALQDCNQALAVAPNDANVYAARAFVRLRRGGFKPAAADATTASNLDPRNPAALYVRGLAEARMGDGGASATDIRAAEAIDPKVGDYYAQWHVRP